MGGRIVDMAGGHGLLAHALLLLDDSSPEAVVIDRVIPPSSAALDAALVERWPRLAGRIHVTAGDLGSVPLGADDLVVSSHACGALTDAVLDRAASARARVAVLPCCHDTDSCEAGPLVGWVDGALAIDIMRAVSLEQRGYRVWTQSISAAITPQNRLLLGAPLGDSPESAAERTVR